MSFWAHFGVTFGAKMIPETESTKTAIIEQFFLEFWVVLGTHVCQFFVNLLCHEAIVDEKGEHVFFVDSWYVFEGFSGFTGDRKL